MGTTEEVKRKLGGPLTTRPKSVKTVMAVGRITIKSLAEFGICLAIFLTSVAGECVTGKLIFGLRENVLLINI